MIKYLFLLLPITIQAADISEFTLETSETLGGFAELSDVTMHNGEECRVDDSGFITCGIVTCTYGGDIEAIASYQNNSLYVVNEAKAGIAVYNMDTCSRERTIMTGLQTGSSGIEGIEGHNGLVYLLEEDGDLFQFTDNGAANVTPTYVFTFSGCTGCGGLGVRSNGNFLAISGPEQATGRVLEYSPAGVYVSELPVYLTNGEGVMEYNGDIIVVGEPNHRAVYSGDTTPDVIINCETTVTQVQYNETQNRIESPTVVVLSGVGCTGYQGIIQ